MPEPPADAGPPAQPAPPDSDPATRMRDAVKPAERPPRKASRGRRRWDRYDYIGAAIVAFLAALWVVHFSLPSLPPDRWAKARTALMNAVSRARRLCPPTYDWFHGIGRLGHRMARKAA
jgi:hypothetical protein